MKTLLQPLTNYFCTFLATQGEMLDKTLAPKYFGDRGYMLIAAETEFHRRTRLGTNEKIEGCCLGTQLFVYGKELFRTEITKSL